MMKSFQRIKNNLVDQFVLIRRYCSFILIQIIFPLFFWDPTTEVIDFVYGKIASSLFQAFR